MTAHAVEQRLLVTIGAGDAFSAGLVGLYLKTPGARRPGSLRPTPEGVGMFKDTWLLGIGLSLLADDVVRTGLRMRR